MSVIYKFAATTKTTKEEIIESEQTKLADAVLEKEETLPTEQQITVANYTAWVAKLLPIIKKAKQKQGLVAKLLGKNSDGSLNIKYTTVNISTLAKEEGVDKSEIKKIWDMA